MKKLILLLLIISSCSKSDDAEVYECDCRTVTPPQSIVSYTYRFCPESVDYEEFYEEFENTYHSADWWQQWVKENPCD